MDSNFLIKFSRYEFKLVLFSINLTKMFENNQDKKMNL